jgi:hypothetical protein
MKPVSSFASASLLVLLAACSDKSPSSAGGASPVASDRTTAFCAKKDLQIFFSPMYSAYDGMHTFKVPAMVGNIDPAAITWSASDPAMVDFENDPALGGVSIAVHKAGEVVIIAKGEDKCGASLLKISQATPEDWMVGSQRYNNGIKLVGDVGRGRMTPDAAPMTDVACTNCHGDTATAGPYKTVAHTPQQTGGFSDEDLIGIFTKGTVPIGGYFDDSFISYDRWRSFHNWQMSPEEAKGVVVYLRSLTPQAQGGMRGDFGGRGNNDGGRGNGGRGNNDGGARPEVAGSDVSPPDVAVD